MDRANTASKYLTNLTCMVEWYEFALFGYFAPLFHSIFFSYKNETGDTLSSAFLIYAAGFISRPIGSLLFGYVGDKYGRMRAIRYTPLYILIITLAFISLPSYHVIGSLSAYAVILLRLLNGVVIGGEFSGNIVYSQEVSKKRWRYYWGSISSCSASLGILLASLAVSFVYNHFSKECITEYAWKIPYIFGALLCLLAFLIRAKLPESYASINRATIEFYNPLGILFTKYKKMLVCLFGIIAYHAVTFYFFFTFLPVMLMTKYANAEASLLLKNSFFLAIHIALIPIIGSLVKHEFSQALIKISILVQIVLTFPMMYTLIYIPHLSFIVILGFSALTALNAALMPGLICSCIPSHIRFSATSIIFNIGFGIFGGITPWLSSYLFNINNSFFLPTIFLIVVLSVSLFSTFQIKLFQESTYA